MNNREKEYQEFHKFYEQCKEFVEPRFSSLPFVISETEDEDEKRFQVLITNFFLQRRQREQLSKEGIEI